MKYETPKTRNGWYIEQIKGEIDETQELLKHRIKLILYVGTIWLEFQQ